jgi:urease alpha subunit
MTTRRGFLTAAAIGLTTAVLPKGLFAEQKKDFIGYTASNAPFVPVRRVLKTSYSVELAQDLKMYHGLDPIDELRAILKQEIEHEVNGVRGTLTPFRQIDPQTFHPRQHFIFRNDGLHGPEDFWGVDINNMVRS